MHFLASLPSSLKLQGCTGNKTSPQDSDAILPSNHNLE